ncbi:MAG: hypothetical protein Q8K24_07060 [Hydrogenophaga sp.]|nr:hypothetical protein [Hydrogenophaga sp.]
MAHSIMNIQSIVSKAIHIFLLTTSACVWAAPVLDDSAFTKGLKAEVALRDCKKMGGMVKTAVTAEVGGAGGWFTVFLFGDDTPEGVSAGKYRISPSQKQLDSLIGKRYCYIS